MIKDASQRGTWIRQKIRQLFFCALSGLEIAHQSHLLCEIFHMGRSANHNDVKIILTTEVRERSRNKISFSSRLSYSEGNRKNWYKLRCPLLGNKSSQSFTVRETDWRFELQQVFSMISKLPIFSDNNKFYELLSGWIKLSFGKLFSRPKGSLGVG